MQVILMAIHWIRFVVLPTANGATTRFGYWVQPTREGCMGFIQTVQLVFSLQDSMLMLSHFILFSFFDG
jgi:hypothetical protein